MNLRGWVIYNGHLPEKKFSEYALWVHQAAKRRGIDIAIHKNHELLSCLTHEEIGILSIPAQELPDFVIFGDKDIYLAKQLENLGVFVFNSSLAIEASDNKITTYQLLAQHQLPIPKTIVAPKIYAGVTKIDFQSFKQIEDILGFPMVIKEAYGSFGEQVYLIHTSAQMEDKIVTLHDKPFVFQELITSSYGKDIRLNVVGDEVVAAMLRTAENDFRANVSAGGAMTAYQASEAETELAITAAKVLGADFAGVDLLFGEDGEPIICEVNANAHIKNIYDCTKINVADYMIEYIVNQFKKQRGRKND